MSTDEILDSPFGWRSHPQFQMQQGDGDQTDTGGDDDLDDEDDDDAGTDDGKEKPKGEVQNPEAKRLSDEAAKRRRQARAFRTERDEARSELEKLKAKDKPELEQVTAERDSLRKQAEQTVELLRNQAVQLAMLQLLPTLKVKPEKAKFVARLLDPDDYEVDDDFEVSGMEEAIQAVLKDNPEWVVSSNGKGDEDEDEDDDKKDDDKRSSGRQAPTKKKGAPGYDLATLQTRFPALRK